ncbi:MAG: AAA family ATPase [Haemophilus parainfluenzae]|jgi:ABC transporter, ATP-binding protein-related protein|nr:AAA family ATPase [Haemophilus parainfluenzae]MDU5805066.1 AAA family ATPase [Haemophilus parainfluenzae]MDU5823181.1 AAA family ATPase [Haemophilus parainfluenzae]OBX70345.1 ABC transporter ATP-binding protein [Haemophilus parainfluenzae]OBX73358.1 ABC transporter ATP-binding protein [Haemophilus parainfluenzae]
MMCNVNIPKKDNSNSELQHEELTLEAGKTTIIIGANGSGKTRLAVYLEEQLGEKAHRIAAHRALSLNPNVDKIPEAKARQYLSYGISMNGISITDRKYYRWDNKAPTILLNDFDRLLQYLFAQQNNLAVENNQKLNRDEEITNSKTKLDILQEVWERLLPLKKLHITADDIRVSSIGIESADYSASEMSDGERAVFYILGQVLSANEDSILIFDEPELHIHKSIISNLWDEIEKLRPDCSFLMITHDIEFAATRVAKKYVIRNYYSDPAWDISEIPDSELDEQTITLILGSRKPILFVEGEKTSLDMETYRLCYPEWTVIPKGACKDVIQAVSSLRKLNKDMPILNIKCAGIVDRDTRDSSQIHELEEQGIKVLLCSEIENIFSLSSVVHEVLKIEGFNGNELNNKKEQFKGRLLDYIKNDLSDDKLEKFVVKRIHRRIDNYLKNIDLSNTQNSKEMKGKLTSEMVALTDSKINEWISEMKDEIQECINNQDIDRLLYIYENKGLLNETALILKSTRKPDFENWLMRQMKVPNSSILQAIKAVLPKFNS